MHVDWRHRVISQNTVLVHLSSWEEHHMVPNVHVASQCHRTILLRGAGYDEAAAANRDVVSDGQHVHLHTVQITL